MNNAKRWTNHVTITAQITIRSRFWFAYEILSGVPKILEEQNDVPCSCRFSRLYIGTTKVQRRYKFQSLGNGSLDILSLRTFELRIKECLEPSGRLLHLISWTNFLT